MKKLIFFVVFVVWASFASAAEYWVYVRTYDRSGVTQEDDAGRSKAGDIIDARPVGPTTRPNESAYKEWHIFKADLTEAQVQAMKEPWVDKSIDEKTKEVVQTPIAYRRNKIDLSVLKATKPGLNETKVTADKIQLSAKTALDLARYSEKQRYFAYYRHKDFAEKYVRKFYDWLVTPAYASTVVSTINKTGEDYDTLTLWEDAKDGDLITAMTAQEAHLYNDDGVLQDQFYFGGWITNATYYAKITSPVGERHSGTVSSGATIYYPANNSDQPVIGLGDCSTDSTGLGLIIEWIIVKRDTAGSYATGIAWLGRYYYATVRNCIVYATAYGGRGSIGIAGARSSSLYVYNCIVYNWGNSAYASGSGINDYYGTMKIYNCTIYNCYRGVDTFDGGTVVKNVLAYNNVNADFDSGMGASSNYNFSKDDTAPGANSIHGTTDGKTPDFVSATDFHLQSSSDAIDVGSDLGTGNGVEIDIDGRDRDAQGDTWDIGADEYVGAEPPAGGGGYIRQPILDGIMRGVL